jgi:hypothetical protein
VLTLSIAFTGWTANELIDVKEDYVTHRDYACDIQDIKESQRTVQHTLEKLTETMYKFHTGG